VRLPLAGWCAAAARDAVVWYSAFVDDEHCLAAADDADCSVDDDSDVRSPADVPTELAVANVAAAAVADACCSVVAAVPAFAIALAVEQFDTFPDGLARIATGRVVDRT